MKFSLVSFYATALLLCLPIGNAGASSLVHSVSQSQAQGLTGNGTTIIVWSGSGTNLDFTQTGETIQRAWLDDPSKLTIDFDSPLCTGGSCKQGGASVVHLRRITGVQFPNLPSTENTLLTIVTQSNRGRKMYLLKIRTDQGNPQYASVAIVPDAKRTESSGIVLTNGKTANWNDVDRGLSRAIQQKLILPNSPVVNQVQTFLAMIHNGISLEKASDRAQVSLALLTKLAEMGYSLI